MKAAASLVFCFLFSSSISENRSWEPFWWSDDIISKTRDPSRHWAYFDHAIGYYVSSTRSSGNILSLVNINCGVNRTIIEKYPITLYQTQTTNADRPEVLPENLRPFSKESKAPFIPYSKGRLLFVLCEPRLVKDTGPQNPSLEKLLMLAQTVLSRAQFFDVRSKALFYFIHEAQGCALIPNLLGSANIKLMYAILNCIKGKEIIFSTLSFIIHEIENTGVFSSVVPSDIMFFSVFMKQWSMIPGLAFLRQPDIEKALFGLQATNLVQPREIIVDINIKDIYVSLISQYDVNKDTRSLSVYYISDATNLDAVVPFMKFMLLETSVLKAIAIAPDVNVSLSAMFSTMEWSVVATILGLAFLVTVLMQRVSGNASIDVFGYLLLTMITVVEFPKRSRKFVVYALTIGLWLLLLQVPAQTFRANLLRELSGIPGAIKVVTECATVVVSPHTTVHRQPVDPQTALFVKYYYNVEGKSRQDKIRWDLVLNAVRSGRAICQKASVLERLQGGVLSKFQFYQVPVSSVLLERVLVEFEEWIDLNTDQSCDYIVKNDTRVSIDETFRKSINVLRKNSDQFNLSESQKLLLTRADYSVLQQLIEGFITRVIKDVEYKDNEGIYILGDHAKEPPKAIRVEITLRFWKLANFLATYGFNYSVNYNAYSKSKAEYLQMNLSNTAHPEDCATRYQYTVEAPNQRCYDEDSFRFTRPEGTVGLRHLLLGFELLLASLPLCLCSFLVECCWRRF